VLKYILSALGHWKVEELGNLGLKKSGLDPEQDYYNKWKMDHWDLGQESNKNCQDQPIIARPDHCYHQDDAGRRSRIRQECLPREGDEVRRQGGCAQGSPVQKLAVATGRSATRINSRGFWAAGTKRSSLYLSPTRGS
jgi:hypothetical protein